ncbi:sensor histidine kinase [Limnofasciculus baicalensis]|uniref:histidine kinase n=1 Tax=Limnofasciculus baicalensis BBK-W-15 TaxID=2699891 RepID=A0AAE3GWM6_9CYAN|nr:response regulator [Limnofasciculus baicalensis]MCP2731839.1 response regulator [Limnofasciculus baicalensis BBK-W-15]
MAKILVIDDDVTVQLVLKNLLKSHGYEVTIAQNGEEGLYQAQLIQPDLIICDWMMPYLDGLEVCRRVKANPDLSSTFLILLTMRDAICDRVKGLDGGADEFISKPIQPDDLLARVRAGLRSSQLIQQLDRDLRQLRETQAELIHSEKMLSLWQLVAGIAHEINNPVTFIYSNLTHVEHYSQELIELLHLYQAITPNPSPQLIDKLNTTDLNFITDDLPKVISSMRRGADRIQKTVKSLQNFSRQHQSGLQAVNLNQEIDNTLLILQHRLWSGNGHSRIEVDKNYGNLPLVECYPSQLNQVFLNILNNAIDAIEENNPQIKSSHQADSGRIIIRTQGLDINRIVIRIANNGPEIPPAIKARIFDPFFTTKPVGTGTGLGLAISYQIVVGQHQGVLKCLSLPEMGTEFWIELPIRWNASLIASPKVLQHSH